MDVKCEDYLTNHKPSFGDLEPKVVTLFERPDFMSLLSGKAVEDITKLAGNSTLCANPSEGKCCDRESKKS